MCKSLTIHVTAISINRQNAKVEAKLKKNPKISLHSACRSKFPSPLRRRFGAWRKVGVFCFKLIVVFFIERIFFRLLESSKPLEATMSLHIQLLEASWAGLKKPYFGKSSEFELFQQLTGRSCPLFGIFVNVSIFRFQQFSVAVRFKRSPSTTKSNMVCIEQSSSTRSYQRKIRRRFHAVYREVQNVGNFKNSKVHKKRENGIDKIPFPFEEKLKTS